MFAYAIFSGTGGTTPPAKHGKVSPNFRNSQKYKAKGQEVNISIFCSGHHNICTRDTCTNMLSSQGTSASGTCQNQGNTSTQLKEYIKFCEEHEHHNSCE